MADLPDYYTQTSIAEAEAAKFKGGLEVNLPAAPTSRDIYLATDTQVLWVCIADGVWTGFDAATLTQGILTLYANLAGGGFQIKNIADPALAQDAATKAYVDLFTLLATFNNHSARHEDTGADEISVAALSGLLADDQHVLDAEVLLVAAALVHAARHQNGGADEISIAGLDGESVELAAHKIVKAANAILGHVIVEDGSDIDVDALGKLTLGAHATRHENAGDDEISVAGLSGLLADDQHVIDAEALAAAWANIDEKSFHNLLYNGDIEVGDPPDEWILGGAAATLSRSNVQAKINTYSALLTRNGTNCVLIQNIEEYVRYRGRFMTIGCWVWASVATRARIGIGDNTGVSFSAYHSGGSTWEWLSITRQIDAAATEVYGEGQIATGDTAAYFDGFILVEGDTCPAFSPKLTALTIFNDHSARHEAGGDDVLNVAGLSGVLADAQTPVTHHTLHELGNADEIVNPLNAGALPALTTGKIWKGVGDRPSEVDPPVVATIVRKTADQTVNNSTTLVDDDHLLLAIGANEVWEFTLVILYISASGTPDLKQNLAIPAGATGATLQTGVDSGDGVLCDTRELPYLSISGTASTLRIVKAQGIIINGETPGNLQYQWAQQTATVEDTKVLTNSFLKATKLA